ncbi:MAG: DUF5011 domain-containing protein [Firmicutes bacterium]|nr:DUF5011 domain-containing protein [Bacillota bacterium]
MKKIKLIFLFFILALIFAGCDTTTPKDLVPPSFIGTKDITFFIGSDEPDFLDGISAIDSIDGDLSALVTYDDSNVDLSTPGIYTLTYIVSDLSGNEIHTSVSIIVIQQTVIIDETPPFIFGQTDITYYLGDEEPNFLSGLVAFDPEDGNLTDQITVDTAGLDLTVVGVYTITYSVSDAVGNEYEITIQVTVIDPDQLVSPDYINIYYINDFHGAILEDADALYGPQLGFANIGNLILDEKTASPMNTLFIAGGDILQGSVISNYFDGTSTIDVLNQLQLDVFTIGNHEFDWGLDIITSFRDPSSQSLQADFPLLGANIFLEGTTTRPDYIEPYAIVERGNLKIGIIGVMGLDLEYSIATSKITGYYFADPVYWTTYYAELLRTQEDVDVVLAILHDDGESTGYNQTMSSLTGNQRIGAVFNGHSHDDYISDNGVRMPYIQSGANGEFVGLITLEFDEFKNITHATAQNLNSSNESKLNEANSDIEALIGTYYSEVESLYTEVILPSGQYMSTASLTTYMSKLMVIATDSDIAFHNSGGTRAPISNGQNITAAVIFQVFPFENVIKTTHLTGSQINAFISSGYGSYYGTRTTNMIFEDDEIYKVATNDYMFDKLEYPYPFQYGTDSEDTGILIRDIMEQIVRDQKEAGYSTFLLSTPIVFLASYEIKLYILDKNPFEQMNTL